VKGSITRLPSNPKQQNPLSHRLSQSSPRKSTVPQTPGPNLNLFSKLQFLILQRTKEELKGDCHKADVTCAFDSPPANHTAPRRLPISPTQGNCDLINSKSPLDGSHQWKRNVPNPIRPVLSMPVQIAFPIRHTDPYADVPSLTMDIFVLSQRHDATGCMSRHLFRLYKTWGYASVTIFSSPCVCETRTPCSNRLH
jgi:hypothetical protein